MPTYSYRCTECGNAFDIVQSFTDDALTVCPECGGPLRKIYNAVGVVFKGSGFYRTDSRGTSGSASSGSSSSAASSSSSGSGSSSSNSDSSSGSGSGSKTPAAGTSTGTSSAPSAS